MMGSGVDYLELVEYSVNYIENHLTDNISRDDFADIIGLSKYHFQRVFKSIVGETTRDYLSKRRLTDAAQQLLETNDRILDIALQYGYKSHEAFSRAFKARFGVTPGEYREIGLPLIIERPPLTLETIQLFHKGFTLEPEIVTKGELAIVGVENPCRLPFDDRELMGLWDQFLSEVKNVYSGRKCPPFIGIYQYLPSIGGFYNSEYCYLAGVAASSIGFIPPGMVKKHIPASQYALFRRKNHWLSRLEIHRYIHGTWLPSSGYERRAEHDIIVIYKGIPTSYEYDIYIPIK